MLLHHCVSPRWLIACLVLLCGCAGNASSNDHYALHFKAEFAAKQAYALVTIRVKQPTDLLKIVDLAAPEQRYQLVSADGQVERSTERIAWVPPADGGTLQYQVSIDSKRGDTYDARITDDWVLVRMGDLFPPARVRAMASASTSSVVQVSGPEGWSFESQYGRLNDTTADVSGPRSYNRPTGWLLGGKLGTRRTTINGRRVVVSSPVGTGTRRMDILSILRWTLPTFSRTFPDLPDHLLVVGAPRCMWRGGLSAPGSLYLHQDRPVISENSTSTLLHELAHLSGLTNGAEDADWLIEGIAEYYSLLVLKRSDGISQRRFERALSLLQDWVDKDKGKLASPSKGADTAAAVLHLHAVAQRLSAAGHSIDELVDRLLKDERVTVAGYEQHLAALLESDLE